MKKTLSFFLTMVTLILMLPVIALGASGGSSLKFTAKVKGSEASYSNKDTLYINKGETILLSFDIVDGKGNRCIGGWYSTDMEDQGLSIAPEPVFEGDMCYASITNNASAEAAGTLTIHAFSADKYASPDFDWALTTPDATFTLHIVSTGVTECEQKGHSLTTTTTKATAKANGKIVTTCTREGCTYKKTTKIKKIDTVKLDHEEYSYTGKAITPGVKVKDSAGKTLKKNTDYKLTYAKERTVVGTYTVKVTFKGQYSGSETLYFDICPMTTSLSSVTATKGGFKATWKKQATQANGYQLQYSTGSNFKTSRISVMNKNSITAAEVSKLTKGKKYYVRIRTCKKAGTTVYYSDWSAAKTVTTGK